MKSKLFLGFSLAEVLISMAVIGIIAAITVPVVTSHYQKQALLTMLQKNYVELDENLTTLQTENYHTKLYGTFLAKGTSGVQRFFSDYYNVKKYCGATAQPCFASSYASIDNPSSSADFTCAGYSVTVASGAAICIIPAAKTTSTDETTGTEVETKSPATVYIDVNGAETPNISGRDLFRLFIYEDYTADEVDPTLTNDEKTTARATLSEQCLTSNTGDGCFTKIYNDNWKMNY